MHRTYSHVGPTGPRLIFKKRGWDVGPTNLMIDFQKWRMDYFVVIFQMDLPFSIFPPSFKNQSLDLQDPHG